jgi:hypothetical protein
MCSVILALIKNASLFPYAPARNRIPIPRFAENFYIDTGKKGKVVPVLNYVVIKNDAMKAYGGVNVQIQIFLTSAEVGGEWSVSRPSHFSPGERAPRTH